MASHKAKLLLASPLLVDPNFDHTVVYLLEHGPEGAVGVVLNRPTEMEVGAPLPAWRRFAGPPGVVYAGGPVSTNAVIGLVRAERDMPAGAFEPVADSIGVLDLNRDADELAASIRSLRIFVGYAGWGPGQLEGELAEGAWYVVESLPDDPFTDEPTDLWRSILVRQGGKLAAVARAPLDLSLN